MRTTLLLALLAATLSCGATDTAQNVASGEPYAPYAFLIGEWGVESELGGPAQMLVQFRWGPGRSYIW
jgi:hypothetical protein